MMPPPVSHVARLWSTIGDDTYSIREPGDNDLRGTHVILRTSWPISRAPRPIPGWLIRLEPTRESSWPGKLSATGQLPLYAGSPTWQLTVAPVGARRLFHLDVCHITQVAGLVFWCSLNFWINRRRIVRHQ